VTKRRSAAEGRCEKAFRDGYREGKKYQHAMDFPEAHGEKEYWHVDSAWAEWQRNHQRAAEEEGLCEAKVICGCPNEATLSVGSGKNNWHLCESCAAMPEFRRYRRRVPLKER
jgi:hypothetical protein